MKIIGYRSLTLLTIALLNLLIISSVSAQSPGKMSYQAVIRNSTDQLVTNATVGMKISILQGSASGMVVYAETQTPPTNSNGLVSIEIGAGTTSDDFSSIDWTDGPYFLKTETDPEGGTNYTIAGTSQLLSVPYALHANTAEMVTGAIDEADPVFGASVVAGITADDTTRWNSKLDSYTETQTLADVLSLSNDGGAAQIKNIAEPTDDQDAATKAYVDELKDRLTYLEELLSKLGLLNVTDADGNSYPIVKIGNQVWMAENLKTTKYNDGTDIPLVTDNSGWGNLNSPGYCWYGNAQAAYGNTYGALYNWHAVSTEKLCPTGWRVPTDSDWIALEEYLGEDENLGGKLKEEGTDHWNSPNAGATNETGFSARPGGFRNGFDGSGTFLDMGNVGCWWTATAYFTHFARFRRMFHDNSTINTNDNHKRNGMSVRCIKN